MAETNAEQRGRPSDWRKINWLAVASVLEGHRGISDLLRKDLILGCETLALYHAQIIAYEKASEDATNKRLRRDPGTCPYCKHPYLRLGWHMKWNRTCAAKAKLEAMTCATQ